MRGQLGIVLAGAIGVSACGNMNNLELESPPETAEEVGCPESEEIVDGPYVTIDENGNMASSISIACPEALTPDPEPTS